jgi:hypothetical protein
MKTKLKLHQISGSSGNNALFKGLMVIVIMLFGLLQMKAQDIVVRNSGDTIFCKITSVDDTKVFFDYAKKDGKIISTFVSRDELKEFRYNVLPSAPAAATKQESKPYSSSSSSSGTLFSVGGGLAGLIGNTGSFYKIGYTLSGDVFKKISNNFLIGGRLEYSFLPPNDSKYLDYISELLGEDVTDLGISVSGGVSIIGIEPCIRFATSAPTSKMFGQIGVGYYMVKEKVTLSGGGESGDIADYSENKFGIHVALGACLYQGASIGFYLYPSYTRIFTEGKALEDLDDMSRIAFEAKATEYWSVNLCIVFGN